MTTDTAPRLLDQITTPADLRRLEPDALRQLADLPRRLASDGTTPGLRLQARLPLSRADVDPPS